LSAEVVARAATSALNSSGRRRAGEGEVGEVEAGYDDAADQDRLVDGARRLPVPGGNEQLRTLAGGDVGPEDVLGRVAGAL